MAYSLYRRERVILNSHRLFLLIILMIPPSSHEPLLTYAGRSRNIHRESHCQEWGHHRNVQISLLYFRKKSRDYTLHLSLYFNLSQRFMKTVEVCSAELRVRVSPRDSSRSHRDIFSASFPSERADLHANNKSTDAPKVFVHPSIMSEPLGRTEYAASLLDPNGDVLDLGPADRLGRYPYQLCIRFHLTTFLWLRRVSDRQIDKKWWHGKLRSWL